MQSYYLLSSRAVASIPQFACIAIVLLLAPASAVLAAEDPSARLTKEVIQARCVKCHGADKPEGDIRLDDLAADVHLDAARWDRVREQLEQGLMPPEDEPRIEPGQLKRVVEWLTLQTSRRPLRLPNEGNLIAHDLLFGTNTLNTAGPVGTPARVWRLSPERYNGFVKDVHRGRADGVVQPFTVTAERGIKDFAALYVIDEASTEVLVRNAEIIVAAQSAHAFKDGKLQGKNDTVGEFVKLMDPELQPTRSQLESAVQTQFRLALGRPATAEEVERFLGLYDKCAATGDRPAAVKTMLQAVLLRAEAMYRAELGSPQADGSGRRLLTAHEVARAIGLALTERRESGIAQAAEKGQLNTKEDVALHVQRILDDPKIKKPGVLQFFREYFEYHRAPDVFKDKPTDKIKHVPQVLVSDTDRLILHILEADQDVLSELLTTSKSFVNYNTKVDKSKPDRPLVGVPFDVIPPPPKDPKNKPEWLGGVDAVYGFSQWPAQQPTQLPAGQRLGILMQPSWLVAWSTNFDNDVVRRGRWIRERLLGGTVPDLPIGVVAQVPDDKHRTYRDRLTVTRDAKCWRCHQQMDDLGLPLENFDHYGRFRTTEAVLDLEATARNVNAKGVALGPVMREAPLDTSGLIVHSGDNQLDGAVRDPREMMQRLATSDRVRQVFIRHVFRYYLGRNETLSDAATLQAADRAYVTSGGSFKALLTSLLTSDSFLYRIETTSTTAAATSSGGQP